MKKLDYISIGIALLAIILVIALVTKIAKAETLTRIAGPDRYATSVEISKAAYPGVISNVVMVSGETFADALSATTLADALGAPVLLTQKNKTPDSVVAEIQRLMPTPQFVQRKIWVIGGTAAVNQGQVGWLTSNMYEVIRLDGADRMETSVKVAITSDNLRGYKPDRVYIVNGFSFADGLAVSPLAASEDRNVLVTENGDLTQSVRDYINGNINVLSDVTLIGGTAAIPSFVDDLFTSNGFGVTRIAGKNRYETATLIAQRLVDRGAAGIGLASGSNFPDALSAGVLMSLRNHALVLDEPTSCGSTANFLQANSSDLIGGEVLGGTSAVSDAAKGVAEQLIGGVQAC